MLQIVDTKWGFPCHFHNVVIEYFSPKSFAFHKSQNLKLVRINFKYRLQGTSTAVFYVYCFVLHVEIFCIVQIAKRCTNPMFAFDIQIPDQVECMVVFALKKKQDLCVSLLFVQYRYTPICNTKEYICKTE